MGESGAACPQSVLAASRNESPRSGALPIKPGGQAATWVGLTSRSLLELAIGIARGFIASGISCTRSTCRSPFSSLAPLTSTAWRVGSCAQKCARQCPDGQAEKSRPDLNTVTRRRGQPRALSKLGSGRATLLCGQLFRNVISCYDGEVHGRPIFTPKPSTPNQQREKRCKPTLSIRRHQASPHFRLANRYSFPCVIKKSWVGRTSSTSQGCFRGSSQWGRFRAGSENPITPPPDVIDRIIVGKNSVRHAATKAERADEHQLLSIHCREERQ